MEYQDETVFVNYEKLDQRQNRQNRDGRREPVESRQDCPAPGELDKAYMKLGKAYYEGGFEEPLPELLPLFDQITRLLKAREQAEESQFCPNCGQKVEKSSVFCGKCGQRLK